ncbi:MAG: hypothetical protein WKF77_04035 [Planctomycetaceae bacterium]
MNLDDLLMNSPEEYNPFETPELTAEPAVASSLQPWRTVVERFRQESRGLAGVAIFFACVAAIQTLAALLSFTISQGFGKIDATSLALGLLWGVVSVGLFVLGLQVARKKMWAVRIQMILAYAVLVLVAATLLYFGTTSLMFAVFAAMILGFVAAQCHRVIGYARTMAAAGIPLHTKPHEITLNHLTPNSDQPSYRV